MYGGKGPETMGLTVEVAEFHIECNARKEERDVGKLTQICTIIWGNIRKLRHSFEGCSLGAFGAIPP